MVDIDAGRKRSIEEARERGDAVQAAALANSKRTEVTALELRNIPFSQSPLFGYDHCQAVSMLAYEIATSQGIHGEELEAIKLAGLMHDCGRATVWTTPDPGHQKLSAELAMQTLRASNESHGRDRLRARVDFLILGMDLSAKDLPRDPALRILWDCDALAAARLAPGTPEGMRVFRERTRNERLCDVWAKDTTMKQRMLAHHGWSL